MIIILYYFVLIYKAFFKIEFGQGKVKNQNKIV